MNRDLLDDRHGLTVQITSLVPLPHGDYRFVAVYAETEVRNCCARYDGSHVTTVLPPLASSDRHAGERRRWLLVTWSPSLRERIRVAVEIAIVRGPVA